MDARSICGLVPFVILVGVWLAFHPEGSWGGIFIVMSLIASGSLWVTFTGGGAGRVFTAAIGMMFLIGAIGVAAKGSFNSEAYQNLSKVITPYPRDKVEYIEERSKHASLRKGQVIWRMRSSDSKSAVARFYEAEENLGDWEIEANEDTIFLRKEEESMAIELDASTGITNVRYDYRGPW